MNDCFQFCPTRNHHYLDISYIKNQLMTKASSIHTIQSERQVCGTAVTLLHPVPECPVQVPPLLHLSQLPANVLRRGNGCSSFICSLLKCLGKQQRMAEVAGSRRNFWARTWPGPPLALLATCCSSTHNGSALTICAVKHQMKKKVKGKASFLF